MSTVPDTRPEGGAPRRWLVITAAVTAGLLALLLPRQIFDTNFYSLWEATNLLAGDHPYRDFFEWGVPLQAALSAAMQWIVGYRMIGEFVLIHWTFIIAGAVISFDLGYRMTRSATLTGITALIALAVLPDTPTFHYPKLFLYPAAIWLAWRYVERPSRRWAVALGLMTAVSFLFRHDHGIYTGVAAVLACILSRVRMPERSWRRTLEDTGAFTATATVLLLPWLVLVQTGEGLPDYVRTRADLFEMWSGEHAFSSILSRNPLQFAEGLSPPPPKPGVVSFRWEDGVTDAFRLELEREHGLRRLDGPDADHRWRYEVDNVYATDLYELEPHTDSVEGLDWDRLEALRAWLPALEPSRLWLAQVTMLIPVLLLLSAAIELARDAGRRTRPAPRTLQVLLTGTVLLLVDAKLFREVSYAHLVAPLTAAMGAHYLRPPRPAALLGWARLATAGIVTTVTLLTAARCADASVVLSRNNLRSVSETLRRLWLHPPINFVITRATADRLMAESSYDAWVKGEVTGWPEILLRYLHDCTTDGDRLLVSGQTPFQVGYLAERPVAGGQVFWHHRWRVDPEHEARLLTLIQSQSIPFAFSTHDPVLHDLQAYPHVQRYFEEHYRELPGSRGHLLVDARRQPSSSFGPYGFPCFK